MGNAPVRSPAVIEEREDVRLIAETIESIERIIAEWNEKGIGNHNHIPAVVLPGWPKVVNARALTVLTQSLDSQIDLLPASAVRRTLATRVERCVRRMEEFNAPPVAAAAAAAPPAHPVNVLPAATPVSLSILDELHGELNTITNGPLASWERGEPGRFGHPHQGKPSNAQKVLHRVEKLQDDNDRLKASTERRLFSHRVSGVHARVTAILAMGDWPRSIANARPAKQQPPISDAASGLTAAEVLAHIDERMKAVNTCITRWEGVCRAIVDGSQHIDCQMHSRSFDEQDQEISALLIDVLPAVPVRSVDDQRAVASVRGRAAALADRLHRVAEAWAQFASLPASTLLAIAADLDDAIPLMQVAHVAVLGPGDAAVMGPGDARTWEWVCPEEHGHMPGLAYVVADSASPSKWRALNRWQASPVARRFPHAIRALTYLVDRALPGDEPLSPDTLRAALEALQAATTRQRLAALGVHSLPH
jgi:hypothetical protein